MHTEQCDDAEEFLYRSATYRAADPIRTNVLGSVATSVAQGFQHYEKLWWWLVVDGGDVIGAACRTEPFWLQLGPMPRDASATLARTMVSHDTSLPGINGLSAVVQDFLDTWCATTSPLASRPWSQTQDNLIYEAGTMRAPDVEGQLRLMTMEDFDLAVEWNNDFSAFIDGAPYHATDLDLEALTAKIEHDMLYCWVLDDLRVSMVGHASPVRIGEHTTTRIGPVYTPEEFRCHGYAAAATAALTRSLQRQSHCVMLLADATYPTSNHVYRGIGYEVVDRFVRIEFS